MALGKGLTKLVFQSKAIFKGDFCYRQLHLSSSRRFIPSQSFLFHNSKKNNMATNDSVSGTRSRDGDSDGEAKESTSSSPSQKRMPYATREKISGIQKQENAEKEIVSGTGSMSSRDDSDKEGKESKSPSQKQTTYATRGKISGIQKQEKVEKEIDTILSLDIKDKRQLYKCRNRYTELKDISTWPEYFSENLESKPSMERWWKQHKEEVVYDINDEFNNKMSLFCGDITTLEIDAIVNAANESLLGGGGVDGAIHSAAGINLLLECELLNGCSPGDSKITCGYKLPAKHVIHTVGPRGERPAVLQNCYKKSLDLLRDKELKSIAFPCISTGIFGYPNLNAAKVALKTIRDWLETEEYAQKVERILLCLFLQKDIDIYQEQMQLYFPLVGVLTETDK